MKAFTETNGYVSGKLLIGSGVCQSLTFLRPGKKKKNLQKKLAYFPISTELWVL